MPWVRIDDAFNDHPKFAAAGPLGIAQWLAGLAYCNRNLTDGFIPRAVAKRLLDWEGVAWRCWQGELMGGGEDAEAVEVSEHLVTVGLWHPVDGGYVVHDFHDYQPSAEMVRVEREKARDRMAKARSGRSSPVTSAEVRPNTQVNSGGSSLAPVPVPVPSSSTPSAPAEAGERGRYPDPAFHSFWEQYPRKDDKAQAFKAWRTARKAAEPDVIIAGAQRYASDPNRDAEFTKYPATWLRAAAWDNGPLPAKTNGARRPEPVRAGFWGDESA